MKKPTMKPQICSKFKYLIQCCYSTLQWRVFSNILTCSTSLHTTFYCIHYTHTTKKSNNIHPSKGQQKTSDDQRARND